MDEKDRLIQELRKENSDLKDKIKLLEEEYGVIGYCTRCGRPLEDYAYNNGIDKWCDLCEGDMLG